MLLALFKGYRISYISHLTGTNQVVIVAAIIRTFSCF